MLMTLILNIFCRTSTESPFYDTTPSWNTYAVFFFVIFVYLVVIAGYNREGLGELL